MRRRKYNHESDWGAKEEILYHESFLLENILYFLLRSQSKSTSPGDYKIYLTSSTYYTKTDETPPCVCICPFPLPLQYGPRLNLAYSGWRCPAILVANVVEEGSKGMKSHSRALGVQPRVNMLPTCPHVCRNAPHHQSLSLSNLIVWAQMHEKKQPKVSPCTSAIPDPGEKPPRNSCWLWKANHGARWY